MRVLRTEKITCLRRNRSNIKKENLYKEREYFKNTFSDNGYSVPLLLGEVF